MKKLLVLLAFIASSAQAEIYTWTDSRGIAHYTNKLDEVPDRYRAKVKSLNYDTGQKTDTSSPQNGPPQPVPPPEPSPPNNAGGNLVPQNAPVIPKVVRPNRHERRLEKTQPRQRGSAPEEE